MGRSQFSMFAALALTGVLAIRALRRSSTRRGADPDGADEGSAADLPADASTAV